VIVVYLVGFRLQPSNVFRADGDQLPTDRRGCCDAHELKLHAGNEGTTPYMRVLSSATAVAGDGRGFCCKMEGFSSATGAERDASGFYFPMEGVS
jgi:hypothetical protein